MFCGFAAKRLWAWGFRPPIVNIIIIIIIITIDGCHYVWQKAQTATLHYTRGPANWPTLKPDTGMLTHLPLGDSGTRLQRHSLPRTSMFWRISLLISWAWVSQRRPWALLLTERRARTTFFQKEGRSSTEARLKKNCSTEVDRYTDDVNKEKEQEQTTFRPQGFIRQEDWVQARRLS